MATQLRTVSLTSPPTAGRHAVAPLLPASASLAPAAKRPPSSSRMPTPKLLNRLRVLGVLLAVITAILAAFAISAPQDRLNGVYTASVQAERLRTVQNDLAHADRNAMLAFALPGEVQEADFDVFSQVMARVYRNTLSAAAVTADKDLPQLMDFTAAAMEYENNIENLRAALIANPETSPAYSLAVYHRQVGDTILPRLDPLIAAADRQVQGSSTTTLATLAIVFACLAAGLLLLVMVLSAQRTHRVLNLWLVGALAALVAQAVQIGSLSLTVGDDISQLRSAETITRVAQDVTTAAWQAQANDALAIIAHHDNSTISADGWATEAEQRLEDALAELAGANLDTSSYAESLAAVQATHNQVNNSLDNPALAYQHLVVSSDINQLAGLTRDQLDLMNSRRSTAPGPGETTSRVFIALGIGLVGLVLAQFGFTARLKEYA